MAPVNGAKLFLLVLLAAPLARAVGPTGEVTAEQAEQVEKARAEIASQLQLQAYDLLDELVYGWMQEAPFPVETTVVLADVNVPVGFGTGLQALVENHFAEVLVKNRSSRVVLTHCPACTSVVVHSTKDGTVVARGVDQPEALRSAGMLSGTRRALFLDFEVEGSALVLRARITSLEPDLPIVWARTLTTALSPAALLRAPEHLKSAEEARKEYLDLLSGRGIALVPIHLGIRSYAKGSDAAVAPVPFIWLEAGAEISLNQARAWTASLMGGVSWLPGQHVGFLGQARIMRLLTGNTVSLTHPDLYAFVGASVIAIHGKSASIFSDKLLTTENVTAAAAGQDPTNTFAAFSLGLELRVKNRFGAGVFLETNPALNNAPNVGNYLDFGVVKFQTLGAEVSFCF